MKNIITINLEDSLEIEIETIYHIDSANNYSEGDRNETGYTGLTLTSSLVF